MGFKSAKNTRNVNQSNGKYEVDDIIFPSRFVFSTIESIDRNLRFFYSPAPPNKLRATINYSSVRDDEEEFNCILDRVEERINRLYEEFYRLDEEVIIIEKDDEALNNKFSGIIDFMYEADDFKYDKEDELSKQTPEYIKKRFIYLANILWKMGICPS